MTVGQLLALEVEDLRDAKCPLLAEIEARFPELDAETDADMGKISPRFLNYRRALLSDASWSQGGMQALVLDKSPEEAAKTLKSMAETCTFFGAKVALAFIRDARPAAMEAAVAIDMLNQAGEEEDEMFEPYWEKLDTIDETFEAYFDDLFRAIRADIHRDPLAWTCVEVAKAS